MLSRVSGIKNQADEYHWSKGKRTKRCPIRRLLAFKIENFCYLANPYYPYCVKNGEQLLFARLAWLLIRKPQEDAANIELDLGDLPIEFN